MHGPTCIVWANLTHFSLDNSIQFHAEDPSANSLADVGKMATAIELLRVFSAFESIRVIFFCMLAILPNYVDVVLLALFTMVAFACLGCILLVGTFKYVQADVYDMPQANFNSMLDSLTTLFQLFIGEAWNAVS